MTDILVPPNGFASNLDGVRIFDVSNHLPTADRRTVDEFEDAHIPGAARFDIDRIADPDSRLPHTVPTPAVFETHMRALGLHDEDHIVLYDDSDVKSAARGWWMLRLFGHERVSILDGGLAAWRQAGGTLESGAMAQQTEGTFTARPAIGVDVVTMAQLADSIDGRNRRTDPRRARRGQILPARRRNHARAFAPVISPARVTCHFPNCSMMTGSTGTPLQSGRLFDAAGIDVAQPVTTTCGSGVTACALAVGLALIGNERTIIYDGSWTEWGAGDA